MKPDRASRPFVLAVPLEELRIQLAGTWRAYSAEGDDVVVDETCWASARGPFLETLVETKIRGSVVHRARGGFAWNPQRQALVTWSKEGSRLRHLGYQKTTSEDGQVFECRFLQSGDRDLVVLRFRCDRNLEIHRVASGHRVLFVRLA